MNECYYILLTSIYYSITSDEIKLTMSKSIQDNNTVEINDYYYILIDIEKILQNLNDNLFIFLNEMYFIDELTKIIEIFVKNKNIKKINEIKNLMRENTLIIQKYCNNEDKLIYELINNFEAIYHSIIKDEIINKNDKDFYDKLRYILLKEIKKVPNIDYRYKILEKLLESNEMLNKSNDIFQILLKIYIKKKYEDKSNAKLDEDDIINILDKTVNHNFELTEFLLYFFEKNALNYLKNINADEKGQIMITKIEDEPLDILKDCSNALSSYIFDPIKLVKEIDKLFCLILKK